MGISLKEQYGKKIKIEEIATDAGYALDPSAGKGRWIRMKNPTSGDVIIINRESNWFKSDVRGESGGLIDFVKFHRQEFPSFVSYRGIRQDTAWEEAKMICDRYLAVPFSLRSETHREEQSALKPFSLEDYRITRDPSPDRMPYLTEMRKLSPRIVKRFCKAGAIWRVQSLEEDRRLEEMKAKDGIERHQRTKYAFPCRIPGQEEVRNFEIKLHYRLNDQKTQKSEIRSYSGMPPGGDKAHTLWIAVFSEKKEPAPAELSRDSSLQDVETSIWPDVRHVYVCEAAIDAMSLTELLHLEQDFAVCSCSGTMMPWGIARLPKIFPNALIHSATDNDIKGRIYDIQMAHFIKGETCTVCHARERGEIRIRARGKETVIREEEFNAASYIRQNGLSLLISKPDLRFKDWNENLQYARMSREEKEVYQKVCPSLRGYYRMLTSGERATEFPPDVILRSEYTRKTKEEEMTV